MIEPIKINKSNPLLPAEDYTLLRKEGIREIEKLGSDIWTDYNTSDPGITILEAVSYAITDLAYRTGFEVKDLIAPEQLTDDTWKQIFYTARQILHNSPLTIADYRKMIIDVDGVRNAWIEPSKDYEVPVWIDYNYFESRDDLDCGCKDSEKITCYGKLGLDAITKENFQEFKDSTTEELDKELKENEEKSKTLDEKIKIITDDPRHNDSELQKMLKRKEKLENRKNDLEALKTKVQSLPDDPIPSKIVEFEGLYNVIVEYEEHIIEEKHREEVRQRVLDRISKNRNLCEDFLTVNGVEYEEFGIGTFIELEEYADPDKVLAQIFFSIYKYFTPSVAFYTIDQMMVKGYLVDEIFEGPPLQHGFIDTKELEKTDLFRDIRLSDLINEIADIKGIKAITYMHMPFKGFNDATAGKNFFTQWIRYLKTERKIAKILPSMSQVVFCKDRDLITYYTGRAGDRRPDRMLKMFNDLKTMEGKYKLSGHDKDFGVPAGEFMELQDYYPVTYSLPMCYGVSDRGGLPVDADEKRKIQALQLKGYLLFFEQILADYLVQLSHLTEIFTMDDSVKYTYFTRPLTEIVELQALLIDHNNYGENHFDKILDDFKHVLQNLAETQKGFHKRRNQMLNHLLARFSEDMSEYENVSRWLTPYNIEERLIEDKIAVLKNGEYYKISTNRGKGYNYTKSDFWDTYNISGTERRVSRLLGFRNVKRRTLATTFVTSEPLMETNPITKVSAQKVNKKNQPLNVIKILDPDNREDILLTSVEVVDGCCTEELMIQILQDADNRENFKFHGDQYQRNRKSAGSSGSYWFDLWDGADPEILLASSIKFTSQADRDQAFKKLQKLMNEINWNEGFHLIEHLLLRPKFDEVLDEAGRETEVKFLQVCLDDCDLGLGLGEETQVPPYRKKIHRIPAEKCFDKLPWILEYYRSTDKGITYKESFLFQQAFVDGSSPVPLKFRRYEALARRIRNLHEFGSERINYEIVWNQEDTPGNSKYSFIIHGNNNEILAQSAFIFIKRTSEEIKNNIEKDYDIEKEIESLMQYFGFELDLYCAENPCDNNEDPYSFRATAVFPCWPRRFRDTTFRNLVEKTIETASPAHVHIKVLWVGINEMQRFENVFYEWLLEMSENEMPDYYKVNPLVDVLNTLKPCGTCNDECH